MYSVTTCEPGAKLVFTQGLTESAAFFHGLLARAGPAPSITDGFEVLVQLVMAAMTTAPCGRSKLAALQAHVPVG